MLQTLADLLESKRTDFVDLIVREAGKPIGYARTELDRGVVTLRMAAEEATRFEGEVVPMDFGIGEGKTALTKRFPVGVVAGITPLRSCICFWWQFSSSVSNVYWSSNR